MSLDRAGKLPPTDTSPDTVIEDLPPQDGSSDGERDERTAREKLKKTSIAGLAQYSKATKATGEHPLGEVVSADTIADGQPENGQARGRPSKKRSFDDLQNEEVAPGIENGGPPLPKKGALHKRMRSREIPGDDEEAQSLDKNEDMASPVQEESGVDAHKSPGGPGVLVSAPSKEEMDAATRANEEDTTTGDTLPCIDPTSDQKPSDLTTRASSSEQVSSSKILASSGFADAQIVSPFANASTASPFASFKSPEKNTEPSISPPENPTSTSAFASSGLSAFASSEKSPFGAIGSTARTTGGFGGGTTSGFGSASGGFGGGSSFASKPTGFGSGGGFGSSVGFGGGGGFGAASKPFGGGLSTFAGPSGRAATFAKSKPFGAKNDEDEDGSDDGGDDDEQQPEEDMSQDPRFHQQELNTGEEDEQTIFTCTAKLYHFEKEWKESGVGDFKINIRYEPRSTPTSSEEDNTAAAEKKTDVDDQDLEAAHSDGSSKLERKARLIMRARGTHRLVLNTPVFKEMNVGTHDGKEPTGKTMHLTSLEGGKPTGYQIKVGKEETLKEIYHKIRELQEEL